MVGPPGQAGCRVSLTLATVLAPERGRLTAHAEVQDPDVQLDAAADGAPTLRIEEGGVRVDLAFPDLDCVRRFVRRVGGVPLATDRR